MTVFDNVGLRPARAEACAAPRSAERVERALDLVQMRDLADRGASKLVGRPAAARGAGARHRLLADGRCCSTSRCRNLDAKLRAEMRVELQRAAAPPRHHVGLRDARPGGGARHLRPHRRDERRRDRADRHARPRSTTGRATRFVADFVGSANLIRGRRGRTWRREASWSSRRRAARSSTAPRPAARPAPSRVLSVRTVHVRLSPRARPRRRQRVAGHGPPPRLPGRLHAVPRRLGRPDALVRWRDREPLDEGETVYLSVEPRHCVLLESESRAQLSRPCPLPLPFPRPGWSSSSRPRS